MRCGVECAKVRTYIYPLFFMCDISSYIIIYLKLWYTQFVALINDIILTLLNSHLLFYFCTFVGIGKFPLGCKRLTRSFR